MNKLIVGLLVTVGMTLFLAQSSFAQASREHRHSHHHHHHHHHHHTVNH